MARATNKDFQAQQDEWVEIEGQGAGDYPPVHVFEEDGDLVGTFLGTEEKVIKGEDRILHNFEVDEDVASFDPEHDGRVQVWGAAILNSRLSELKPGDRAKVIKTGKKITTGSGRRANEFVVFGSAKALRA